MLFDCMLLESKRKVQQSNTGSYFVTINKQWANYNSIKKGSELIEICGASICVMIAPNSPLATIEGLARFKAELINW